MASIQDVSAWGIVDLTSNNPFVLDDIEEKAKGNESIFGVMNVSHGQKMIEVFTWKNQKNRLVGEDLKKVQGELNPKTEEEIERLISWYKCGFLGVVTLLTRENGPLATAAAFALTNIPLSSMESGLRVQDFRKLEKTARDCAEKVYELHLNLMRHQLSERYANQVSGNSSSFQSSGTAFSGKEDEVDSKLWIFNRLQSGITRFSSVDLAYKLKDIGFDFKDNFSPIFFARLVREDLSKKAKQVEQEDGKYVVSSKEVWDSVLKIAVENQIKPNPSKLDEESSYTQKLYACNEINDYPLDLFLDLMHVGSK